MKRREFLKFIGAGGVAAAAGFIFGRTASPGAKLMPVLIPTTNAWPANIIRASNAVRRGLCIQVRVMTAA